MTGEEIRSGDVTSNLTLKSRIQVGVRVARAGCVCTYSTGESGKLADFELDVICMRSFVSFGTALCLNLPKYD